MIQVEEEDDNHITSEIVNKNELLLIIENLLSQFSIEKNQIGNQDKLLFGFIGNKVGLHIQLLYTM